MDKSSFTRKEFLNKLGIGTFAMAASGLLLPKSVMGGVGDNLNDGELAKQVSTNTKNISTNAGNITSLNTKVSAKIDGFTSDTYAAVTGLAYDATNKKLGLKVGADTIIPFSETSAKKITYVSESAEIDVSAYLGATIDNFKLVYRDYYGATTSNKGTGEYIFYYPVMKLSGTTLSVTCAYFTWKTSNYSVTTRFPCYVFYINL